MWNHEHEAKFEAGSVAETLFAGEPLRDATVRDLSSEGDRVAIAVECDWECREFDHEPGPSGEWSQRLEIRFEGVAGLRVDVTPAAGDVYGTLVNVRAKDTPWRRRAEAERGSPIHQLRLQTNYSVVDVLYAGVTAERADGRGIDERLQGRLPFSLPGPAPADDAETLRKLAETAADGDWWERVDALRDLARAGDPSFVGAVRRALRGPEPAVTAAAVHALGFLGDRSDLARLVRLEPPADAFPPAFRAHVGDAVDRIVERLGGSGSPGNAPAAPESG